MHQPKQNHFPCPYACQPPQRIHTTTMCYRSNDFIIASLVSSCLCVIKLTMLSTLYKLPWHKSTTIHACTSLTWTRTIICAMSLSCPFSGAWHHYDLLRHCPILHQIVDVTDFVVLRPRDVCLVLAQNVLMRMYCSLHTCAIHITWGEYDISWNLHFLRFIFDLVCVDNTSSAS